MKFVSMVAVGLVGTALFHMGCSSDPEQSGSSSGTGQGASSGAGGDNSCACNVTMNGVSKELACESTDCVNGQKFACGADAKVSQLGACTTTSSSSSSGGSSSGGSSSGGSSSSSSGSSGSTCAGMFACGTGGLKCDVSKQACSLFGGAKCVPALGCSDCDAVKAQYNVCSGTKTFSCSGASKTGVSFTCQ